MKKYLLFATILLQTTFLFAQYSSSNPQYSWGSWTQPTCYKGIYIRVQKAYFNKGANEWYWNWEMQNRYGVKVSISWKFYNSANGVPTNTNSRHTFEPNEKLTNGNFGGESELSVIFQDACFTFKNSNGTILDDCSSDPGTFRKNYYYSDCDNGSPNIKKYDGSSTNNSSGNTITHQQNDPTFDRNNANYQDYYKRATAAGQAGNYDEAISLWKSAISVAVNDVQKENAQAWLAEAEKAKANATNNNIQKQQELQRQQQKQQQEKEKQQQLQQGINQLTTATSDLVTLLASRKRASKSSLSNEDVQALLGIVNSETPLNYTQTIIDIFSDLGYTYKSSQKMSYGGIFISMYDNSTIQWPLSITIDPASNYDVYNKINFDYQRKDRLKSQLSTLGNNLVGFTIKGISPERNKLKIEEDKKNLDEKSKNATRLIEDFNKNNYWSSSDRAVFSYSKDIAEAYEDKDALNNKSEAIRYYRKAASIPLDSLTSPWKGDKNMASYQQKELAKVCFQLGYLLANEDGNEAISWYKKASEVFKVTTSINIGNIYRLGSGGVAKDYNEAKNHYEIAAEEKRAQAMYSIGLLYKTGGPNLEKDESKSKKWFKKACKEDKKYCD